MAVGRAGTTTRAARTCSRYTRRSLPATELSYSMGILTRVSPIYTMVRRQSSFADWCRWLRYWCLFDHGFETRCRRLQSGGCSISRTSKAGRRARSGRPASTNEPLASPDLSSKTPRIDAVLTGAFVAAARVSRRSGGRLRHLLRRRRRQPGRVELHVRDGEGERPYGAAVPAQARDGALPELHHGASQMQGIFIGLPW